MTYQTHQSQTVSLSREHQSILSQISTFEISLHVHLLFFVRSQRISSAYFVADRGMT